MQRKINFIIAFIALSVCLGFMSTTYSRYVSDTTGNIDMLFAKWQILVNNNDITNNNNSSIAFEPIIQENENIASDTIAPSSKGYFDIDIDPSNVDVSFKYLLTLSIDNENMPDIMITQYAYIPEDYDEENDTLELIDLETNEIAEELKYEKETPNFKFEPKKIRVFFEWYEGDNENMDDEADTTVGYLAAEDGLKLKINANIRFEQIFKVTEEEIVE